MYPYQNCSFHTQEKYGTMKLINSRPKNLFFFLVSTISSTENKLLFLNSEGKRKWKGLSFHLDQIFPVIWSSSWENTYDMLSKKT